MKINQNDRKKDLSLKILYVDMNSFFASCEQQVNYYLRNLPIAVCVYPGKFGAVIAPSIEAKKKGIKLGMRLDEAIKKCPELIPIETHPNRYREFHVEIMNVLRKYSKHVIPKSIDEAFVNFSDCKFKEATFVELAEQIKKDIREEVGDYLKCSIGIAPNEFLAKLATDIKKPDGLTVISTENIDSILKKLSLTDLPGIAKAMALRLKTSGIETPLQLRHTPPEELKRACQSIVGLYWHYRLNFSEVDIAMEDYKSMQAMRQISKSQRKNIQSLWDLLASLCLTLEKRMVKQSVYCKQIIFNTRYEDGKYYREIIHCDNPVQEGSQILGLIKNRMKLYEKENNFEPVVNTLVNMMGVNVFNFVPDEVVQFDLFDNNVQRHKLRKAISEVRGKFGNEIIKKAVENHDKQAMADAIGFGSVKHLFEK